MSMSNSNGIVAKNSEGKLLFFTGIEDFHTHMEEFQECMKRHGHEGVLSADNIEEPMRPDANCNKRYHFKCGAESYHKIWWMEFCQRAKKL